jgi:hypothetical protein
MEIKIENFLLFVLLANFNFIEWQGIFAKQVEGREKEIRLVEYAVNQEFQKSMIITY